jgi:large subunit ribosomal protein L3
LSSVFDVEGGVVPVWVVAVGPNVVTRLRTPERDGYAAVQVGTDPVPRLSKPRAGQLVGLPNLATLREFRVESLEGFTVGQTLGVDLFQPGDLVDVTGVSKGKGFAGQIKRHHFRRGPKSHGSQSYREPGSIGPGTTPGRVYKGLRMAGHMGARRTTVKKLTVVRTDAERNLLLVKGAVPGPRGALLLVKKA